jgi:hypothetical protein
MSEESMTLGEALKTAHCPKCGAVPGEDCRDVKPLPEGQHRVHTQRLYAKQARTGTT